MRQQESQNMKTILYKLYFICIFLIGLSTSASASTFLFSTENEDTDSLQSYLPADSIFAHFLKQRNIPLTQHNQLELLPSGREKFNSLFEAIKQAKHHIHMEYFNFRSDSIAKEMFTLLAEKAKEGVKVRTMFDAFGNFSNNRPLKKEHLKMLNERGIEIVKFDPIRFPYINHVFCRDHQKIVIIDGKVGYTGGMNIADYYINGLPEIGAWRDMHIRIEGPAVEQLQQAFLHVWNKETKQKVNGQEFFPFSKDSLDRLPVSAGNQVAIVQRVPHDNPDIIRKAYIAAIDAAEHKIQIINPYFTPTSSIRKAIKRAARRGVRVEIMIPGKSDIPFTPDAGFYIANRLRKAGAHIYIFNGGFHHSKIMIVDDRFCTVGSTNLNSRSLRYDYEINAFIFDLPLTNELGHIFHEDKQCSTIMTREEYKKRSAWRRFVGWFANLFTPMI